MKKILFFFFNRNMHLYSHSLSGALQWPRWLQTLMKLFFLFRFLSSWRRIIRALVSIPPFVCFSLHVSVTPHPPSTELLMPPCAITSMFHFYFSKRPQMLPPGPHFSTDKRLAFPARTWHRASSLPLLFFFIFFPLAAPLNRTRKRRSSVQYTNVLLNRPVFRSSI